MLSDYQQDAKELHDWHLSQNSIICFIQQCAIACLLQG